MDNGLNHEELAKTINACFVRLHNTPTDGIGRIYFEIAGEWVEVIVPSPDYAAVCAKALARATTAPPPVSKYRIILADGIISGQLTAGLQFPKILPPQFIDKLKKEYGLNISILGNPHVVQLYNENARTGVQLVFDNGHLPPWESGSPLKTFLHWIAIQKGMFMMHGGTLSDGNRGILLAGRGGSGKSGTVLAGLSAGLKSCGDDYVMLDHQNTYYANSLYGIMKQDMSGFQRCGLDLAPLQLMQRNWQNKVEARPEQVGLAPMVQGFMINAIVFPTVDISSTSTTFERIDQKDVPQGLVRGAINEVQGSLGQSILFALRIFKALPAYRLQLGTSARGISEALAALLMEC